MNQDQEHQNVAFAVEQISIDESHINNQPDEDGLSIMPTRNLVLFPNVTISISLGRDISERVAQKAYEGHKPVGVVCQKNEAEDSPTLSTGLYKYGVLVDILRIIELPNGEKTVLVRGREAFRIKGAGKKAGHVPGAISARIEILQEERPEENDRKFASLIKSIKGKLTGILPGMPEPLGQMLNSVLHTDDAELMVNVLLTNIPFQTSQKIKLLAEKNVMKRAMGLLRMLVIKEQEMSISLDIMRKVRADMDEEQRRAFLHQEMVNIQEQLYGDSTNDISELEQRAENAYLPEATAKIFDRELTKLRRQNPQSPDYSVIYTYLDTMLDLPWNESDPINQDFDAAREALDKEHCGLEKVKERIYEQLAVLMHNPDGKAPILCLVGPPGVGKTSLGQSIANALGRAYQRVSLGGLHDESELRGHRRTYIGAMPGRIIDAMRKAGKTNPVLVLDEIDKIGADYKGDPAAALLEVLDPEQNFKFHDNYIDVDYDLSKVLFIATANTLGTVAQPLVDRMEVIELSGYINEEKIDIARRHLLRRISASLAIEPDAVKLSDAALAEVIESYTNESGVRQLEKQLSKICRKYVMAKMKGEEFPEVVEPHHLRGMLGLPVHNKDRWEDNIFAGVVTGLAWTQTGGEILLVESSLTPGKGGKLTLTGNLGDVMKESATIAYQWVKAHAQQLGIDSGLFDSYHLHIHFPEGAIPKDGPSAGITIATSIVSTFRQTRVAPRLAMTGEITLRGKVLPVGGIKEKILAAHRAGITDIILSEENRKDIEDIAPKYIEGLTFHYVKTALEVMRMAVTDEPVVDALTLEVSRGTDA